MPKQTQTERIWVSFGGCIRGFIPVGYDTPGADIVLPILCGVVFFGVSPLGRARTPGQENRDKKTGRENPVPLVDDLKIRTYTVNRIAPGVPADEHGIEHPGHSFSHSRTS